MRREEQLQKENIMGKIKSMDGTGSGLDADLLDGKHGSEYATKEIRRLNRLLKKERERN